MRWIGAAEADSAALGWSAAEQFQDKMRRLGACSRPSFFANLCCRIWKQGHISHQRLRISLTEKTDTMEFDGRYYNQENADFDLNFHSKMPINPPNPPQFQSFVGNGGNSAKTQSRSNAKRKMMKSTKISDSTKILNPPEIRLSRPSIYKRNG